MTEIKQDEFEQDYKDFIENYWKNKQGLKDLEDSQNTLDECDDMLKNMGETIEGWKKSKEASEKWRDKLLTIKQDAPFFVSND